MHGGRLCLPKDLAVGDIVLPRNAQYLAETSHVVDI